MKKIAIAAAAIVLSVSAHAEPYAVVSGGIAHASDDCAGISSCDLNSFGFKLLGGYKINKDFGIEAGYYNLGKESAADAGISVSIKTGGVGVGAAIFTDLAPQLQAFGRLGLALLKTKVDASAGLGSASDSETNVGLVAGLGVGYKVMPNMSVDLGIDFGKHKYSGGSSNVTVFGLGLTTSF
ncbi:MAG: hypothetical protein RLY71_96 [Pseudomonadota bacterium]|jgi:OOP family OmpA-OmpF porin